jgi:hypothetical protein
MRLRALSIGILALALLASASAQAATPAAWASPQRLVRTDHVESAGVKAFEDARRAWVASARSGGAPVDTGLALVWSGTDGGRTTYVMSSPFARYAELDGRRDLDGGSEGKAGNAYFEGPHTLEIWRRVDALSFPSARDPGVDEFNAGAVRIEVLTETDPRKRSELVATWKAVAAALASQKYPLASMAYENRFVEGQLIRVWLAKDAATLKAAPPISTWLAWASGEGTARELKVKLNQLTDVRRYFSLERRNDLSAASP